MLFVIEGLDGVGKSTLKNGLAKNGYLTYATPPEEFRVRRAEIDEVASPDEQYKFYLESVKAASEALKKLLIINENIFVDRYWLTTLVYHSLKGVVVNPDDFHDIIKPDFTFFLTVNYQEQQSRLFKRGLSTNDKEMQGRYLDLTSSYNHFLVNLEKNYEVIDTSDISSEDLLAHVLAKAKDKAKAKALI